MMQHSQLKTTCTTIILATSFATAASAAAPQFRGIVSPAGTIRIERKGKEIASLVPGLFEKGWKYAAMSEGKAGQVFAGDVHRGTITAPGGTVVDVQLRVSPDGDKIGLEYRLVPQADVALNSLHVSLGLPARNWAGGSFVADKYSASLPAQFDKTSLHSASMNSLRLVDVDNAALQLDFAESTQVLIQDDRQWGQTFSVRIGPQLGDAEIWPAGKSLTLKLVLRGDGGLTLEEDRPVTIEPGPNWLPLDVTLDIETGSALDFSRVIPHHAPAGKFGRVIVNSAGKFAFADRPDGAVRFYGVNLCFSAHYLDRDVADQLAERLLRLGYNALRIHHYERDLVDHSSPDEIRFDPKKLDQLDYLFAALKQRGIYVTTDLFVSRPVPKARIYPGLDGEISMNDYKMAVHVNERAFADFQDFSRALLNHVNPYTKLRYADDPTLSWLSLVNEDNPGNFASRLEGPLRDDVRNAWNRWLASRFPERSALQSALGELPDDQDPTTGNVPLQDVHANSPAAIQFNVFLAEVEQDFFDRTRQFLRDELHCNALLTDMNAWTNPLQMQAVRGSFDYVDDHFYVDHPRFLERSWSLPSSCPNTSPIADGAPGGRSCAFTRLYGKPFTITEFNYSSPGRFRGVGGILTGALGALQDWDGVWRFAYSHSRDSISEPRPLNYFDVASDPLNQAAERASLCLFLRGDLQPAEHALALAATDDQLLKTPTTSRDKTPSWNALAWLTRVGWMLGSERTSDVVGQATLPIIGGRIDPFASDAGQRIVDGLRSRGWISSDNRTDLAENRLVSENGQITIDAPANVFKLDTARTAGGFAPADARIETRHAKIEIHETDATVWISSLDERPLDASRRLLITHLTDLQNSEARYADQARKVLLGWGHLPHLVQTGRATVTLRRPNASGAKVYGLATSGARTGAVDATITPNQLVIPLSVADNGKARMLYEVVLPKTQTFTSPPTDDS